MICNRDLLFAESIVRAFYNDEYIHLASASIRINPLELPKDEETYRLAGEYLAAHSIKFYVPEVICK